MSGAGHGHAGTWLTQGARAGADGAGGEEPSRGWGVKDTLPAKVSTGTGEWDGIAMRHLAPFPLGTEEKTNKTKGGRRAGVS